MRIKTKGDDPKVRVVKTNPLFIGETLRKVLWFSFRDAIDAISKCSEDLLNTDVDFARFSAACSFQLGKSG
jgi:hypothetical protein